MITESVLKKFELLKDVLDDLKDELTAWDGSANSKAGELIIREVCDLARRLEKHDCPACNLSDEERTEIHGWNAALINMRSGIGRTWPQYMKASAVPGSKVVLTKQGHDAIATTMRIVIDHTEAIVHRALKSVGGRDYVGQRERIDSWNDAVRLVLQELRSKAPEIQSQAQAKVGAWRPH